MREDFFLMNCPVNYSLHLQLLDLVFSEIVSSVFDIRVEIYKIKIFTLLL